MADPVMEAINNGLRTLWTASVVKYREWTYRQAKENLDQALQKGDDVKATPEQLAKAKGMIEIEMVKLGANIGDYAPNEILRAAKTLIKESPEDFAT